jgi:hypothetical protein
MNKGTEGQSYSFKIILDVGIEVIDLSCSQVAQAFDKELMIKSD